MNRGTSSVQKFLQNRKIQNVHNHHHLQAGQQAQHGGVGLHGLKVGRNGTRTGGKTTNGQNNGEVRRHRTHVQVAAGNSMRKRQVQHCHHQPVSLTAVLFHFLRSCWIWQFRTQPVATAVRATEGCRHHTNLYPRRRTFSRAHITVYNSLIDPHSSSHIGIGSRFKGSVSPISQNRCHLFVMS